MSNCEIHDCLRKEICTNLSNLKKSGQFPYLNYKIFSNLEQGALQYQKDPIIYIEYQNNWPTYAKNCMIKLVQVTCQLFFQLDDYSKNIFFSFYNPDSTTHLQITLLGHDLQTILSRFGPEFNLIYGLQFFKRPRLAELQQLIIFFCFLAKFQGNV